MMRPNRYQLGWPMLRLPLKHGVERKVISASGFQRPWIESRARSQAKTC
jgi:hypothetical protein